MGKIAKFFGRSSSKAAAPSDTAVLNDSQRDEIARICTTILNNYTARSSGPLDTTEVILDNTTARSGGAGVLPNTNTRSEVPSKVVIKAPSSTNSSTSTESGSDDPPAAATTENVGYDEFMNFLASEQKTSGVSKGEEVTKDEAPSMDAPTVSAGDVKVAEETGPPTSASGQCPFRHGTVYARPYPGYAHGNPKKGVCPNGCRPETDCDITERETPKETLLREAMEYIELYYHERGEEMKDVKGFATKEERKEEVRELIEETGTYEHTFDELQHGARVAWRNAPKCSNRKYWQNLKLIDCRKKSETNQEMFDACLGHLSKAMACGSSEAYISVFKPAKPGTVEGPRIWNEQLLSYAAYTEGGQSEVVGDPKNLRFTQMLEERFGWTGPPDGKRGSYDYLPLVIQADPNGDAELFELPLNCVAPVHIFHPRYPELSELKMQWYPIPAVCALDMSLGGILYTAIPFNGWYADTEVLRDLVDETRYNMMIPIANALGLNTDLKPGEPPYYKEDVLSVLCKAIYHSFQTSKVAMIDHHNLIDMFWDWYRDELASRSYCPVNWKWVIPPMSSSTNSAYLGLAKAQEYTLKPAYLVGKGFVQLEKEAFGKRCLEKPFENLFVCMIFGIKIKRWLKEIRARKLSALIIYASVTGNSAKYASDLGSLLSGCCNITFFDACGVNSSSDADIMTHVQESKLVIFVSSTQGNGEIPSLSEKFFSILFGVKGHLLMNKECAVLGFGSSSYPIFCGAAKFISEQLAKNGAVEVIPRGQCDAVKGEAQAFNSWTYALVDAMACKPDASTDFVKLSQTIQKRKSEIVAQRRHILRSLKVQVYTSEQCRMAAGDMFVKQRSSLNMLKSSQVFGRGLSRRGTQDSTGQPSMSKLDSLRSIITNAALFGDEEEGVFEGYIDSRTEMLNKSEDGEDQRGTSLIKIDISTCGNPPYEPGDHVRVYPRNTISKEKLACFISNLSRNLKIGDEVYLSIEGTHTDLKVHLPLLHPLLDTLVPLKRLFEKELALSAPVSMEACIDLAEIARGKDKERLQELGSDDDKYEAMVESSGLKWIDLFTTFPSLAKEVSIEFLLCSMKKNHVRSYSIASCKQLVGNELHLVVGRFLYSRGDNKKQEVGVCSNFLTTLEVDDKVLFTIETMRSFHLPSDPSSAAFMICTGTGYAPMRGLLQKRAYFLRRGEKLGPAYLILGSRSSREGLFHNEIREYHEEGVISGVFFCYSREPGTKKEYTTDKLRSPEVKTILGPFLSLHNSHVYICGSANMAEECKTTLRAVTSDEVYDSMEKDGRIHCDVFGALHDKK